jgi:hypothetical protein
MGTNAEMIHGGQAAIERHVLGEIPDARKEVLALDRSAAGHLCITGAGRGQADQ